MDLYVFANKLGPFIFFFFDSRTSLVHVYLVVLYEFPTNGGVRSLLGLVNFLTHGGVRPL